MSKRLYSIRPLKWKKSTCWNWRTAYTSFGYFGVFRNRIDLETHFYKFYPYRLARKGGGFNWNAVESKPCDSLEHGMKICETQYKQMVLDCLNDETFKKE